MVTIPMRIIKRKKGTKEYFYLQHSYRKKSKVITKERYLGKKIHITHVERIADPFVKSHLKKPERKPNDN